jgi:hypothetical protein
VHFREILSGYFLFSRFDWSIFVTQLVAKHMKEIIKIIIFHLLTYKIRSKKKSADYKGSLMKLILEVGRFYRLVPLIQSTKRLSRIITQITFAE